MCALQVRLVNHAFEMPVVVPPQIAEDFEGVEEQGRRSKGKVKAVVRAKVGVRLVWLAVVLGVCGVCWCGWKRVAVCASSLLWW